MVHLRFLIFISLELWHSHESVSLYVDVIREVHRGRKKTLNTVALGHKKSNIRVLFTF